MFAMERTKAVAKWPKSDKQRSPCRIDHNEAVRVSWWTTVHDQITAITGQADSSQTRDARTTTLGIQQGGDRHRRPTNVQHAVYCHRKWMSERYWNTCLHAQKRNGQLYNYRTVSIYLFHTTFMGFFFNYKY